MFNWAKQQLANVAGTQEPIYGPSAIRSVGQEAEAAKTPYTELTRDDFKWQEMDTTNVETQTFYFVADSGRIAIAQVIYNNIACVPILSASSELLLIAFILVVASESLPSSMSRFSPRILRSLTSGALAH
jgi:hypothetical protein